MNSGRGRGRLAVFSNCRDADGLLVDEWLGVDPGNGTLVYIYEFDIGNMVGRG